MAEILAGIYFDGLAFFESNLPMFPNHQMITLWHKNLFNYAKLKSAKCYTVF